MKEQALKVTSPKRDPPSLLFNCPACRLLGHAIEEQALKVTIPKRLSAPGLPELNHSQVGPSGAVGLTGDCVAATVWQQLPMIGRQQGGWTKLKYSSKWRVGGWVVARLPMRMQHELLPMQCSWAAGCQAGKVASPSCASL